jgi:hypothetical protein
MSACNLHLQYVSGRGFEHSINMLVHGKAKGPPSMALGLLVGPAVVIACILNEAMQGQAV